MKTTASSHVVNKKNKNQLKYMLLKMSRFSCLSNECM